MSSAPSPRAAGPSAPRPGGAATGKYWVAFAATLVAVWALGVGGIMIAANAAATCTAASVDRAGAGTYRCLVDFSDKVRQSYQVTVDADGKWVTDSGTN